MSQFESIHIQGFRRLVDVNLKLRPLMVMIGANGCGKTSLLNAWQLLAALSDGKLADMLSSLGGFNEVMTRQHAGGEPTKSMSFQVRLKKPACEYSIRLLPLGAWAYYLEDELSSIDFEPRPNSSGTDPFPSESCLSHTRGGQGAELRETLSSQFFASSFDVEEMRRPQSIRPSQLPGARGDLLVSCLYSMRETDRDRFAVVEDTLRAAFPDFERLEFPPVAAGMLAMAWKDRQFTQPIYMNQFSEGTLRFLWLTALLLSRDLPPVTLIDEPEVSLHPELLSVLADCMREASQRTQLIVATHADRLVRFLTPEEVVVLDMEDGATKATRADELDLEEWLSEYTLDQVWQHGRMGGRS